MQSGRHYSLAKCMDVNSVIYAHNLYCMFIFSVPLREFGNPTITRSIIYQYRYELIGAFLFVGLVHYSLFPHAARHIMRSYS
jgi:hypothetical protein